MRSLGKFSSFFLCPARSLSLRRDSFIIECSCMFLRAKFNVYYVSIYRTLIRGWWEWGEEWRINLDLLVEQLALRGGLPNWDVLQAYSFTFDRRSEKTSAMLN